MKTNPVPFFMVLTLMLALSCSSSRPLDHFVISPMGKPFPEKKETPLYVVLDAQIADALWLGMEGPRKLKVREFRMSLQDALSATFAPNFRTIYFVDKAPQQSLSMKIQQMEATWQAADQTAQVANSKQSQPFQSAFKVQATLDHHGRTMQVATIESLGSIHFDDQDKIKAFKEGLQASCEALSHQLFTDTIIDQLK